MAALRCGMAHVVWLMLLALLQGRAAAIADSCKALNDQMAHLNPGFWPPSFVFRSLQVRPGAIHPPNKTRQTGESTLVGVCDSALFRADVFQWQKPTSDGGDWIATTKSAPMQIEVDGVACPLSGIALTTLGWPSLRLQFEQCPRKTAVEVPLVNSSENGMKLVHWMCKVSIDSDLCRQANELLPASLRRDDWSDPVVLDLSSLAAAASQGVDRMQIYDKQNCYENLDWFIIDTPLGVDASEFPMIQAIMKVLAPNFHNQVRIQSNVVAETVCFPDCSGNVAQKCKAAAATTTVAPTAAPEEAPDLGTFLQEMSDKAVLPWFVYFCGAFLLLGSLLSCCIASCCCQPVPEKNERRIKKVAVVYHEVPEESQSFFLN